MRLITFYKFNIVDNKHILLPPEEWHLKLFAFEHLEPENFYSGALWEYFRKSHNLPMLGGLSKCYMVDGEISEDCVEERVYVAEPIPHYIVKTNAAPNWYAMYTLGDTLSRTVKKITPVEIKDDRALFLEELDIFTRTVNVADLLFMDMSSEFGLRRINSFKLCEVCGNVWTNVVDVHNRNVCSKRCLYTRGCFIPQ